MHFLAETILLNFYFFIAFTFFYIIFKIINNKFVNNVYKKNLSLILLSVILNLWLLYLLSLINKEFKSSQNTIFFLYNFFFFLFIIVVSVFLNQFHTIITTIIGVVYILIKNQNYGILVLIPFILIIILIIFQSIFIRNPRGNFFKQNLSLILIASGIPLSIIIFLLNAILKYNVRYDNAGILAMIIIFWILTFTFTSLVLHFISKVFLNLDNIYNNSLFATAGVFQSGIAPKIIKHFLQSENVKVAYLFVFQQETDINYLQYHVNEKDIFESIKKLFDSLELNNNQNNKEIKFKIDEKHFGLILKIDQIKNLSHKYFGNFLKNRDFDDDLLFYQNEVNKFNKNSNSHKFNCGLAIYGIHSYSINKLIHYAKFAIHWSKLKKLNNNVQLFNRQNLFNFNQEKKQIQELNSMFNLYQHKDNTDLVKINNSNDAILIYNIRNQYKFKSLFNKYLTNDHLLESDFKRYSIYQKLKHLETDNRLKITKLYFQYPWKKINEKSFDINTMINNLKKTAPKIKKSIIFNIDDQNFQNLRLQKNIIILIKNNIEIVLDLTTIKNDKKLIKIVNFYSPNAIIINKQDKKIEKIKIILKSKNEYYYF